MGFFLELSGVICLKRDKMYLRQNKCWGPRWETIMKKDVYTVSLGHNHGKRSNKEVNTSFWNFLSPYITKKKSLDQSLYPKSIILWIIHQKSQGKSSLNFMGQLQISQKAESSSLLVNTNIGRLCNHILWFFWVNADTIRIWLGELWGYKLNL